LINHICRCGYFLKEAVMTKDVQEVVASKYGAIAGSGLSGDHAGVREVAEAFGYSVEELRSIPAGANMGLSCGNPTAFANIRRGEVVVDLGCGGGLDVFLASEKVGPAGRSIGIDMTPEMIERARRNAQAGVDGRPYDNVEFHLSTIDKLPLADSSVDCVISNCVINLAPDKQAVFREIARVLKPGGRLGISDIALKQPLPPDISNDLLAYVGCVAGAMLIDDYRDKLVAVGLTNVEIIDTRADLMAYAKLENQHSAGALPVAGCCAPGKTSFSDLLKKYNINEYAASVRVFAAKPREQ
jgi:ubiquinone/menaquinone biosynthesis C-methylase UbiE